MTRLHPHCRLVTEFGLRGEPEVLVFTLVLVERLLRVHPNLLLPCTLRPVLLVALVLGLKIMCDESLSGAKKAIARAGLVHVDGYHLWQLEGAYLDAVAWDVSGCQTSHACVMRWWIGAGPQVHYSRDSFFLCAHRLPPAHATGQRGGAAVPSVHV